MGKKLQTGVCSAVTLYTNNFPQASFFCNKFFFTGDLFFGEEGEGKERQGRFPPEAGLRQLRRGTFSAIFR
jgi:hypothetical protein